MLGAAPHRLHGQVSEDARTFLSPLPFGCRPWYITFSFFVILMPLASRGVAHSVGLSLGVVVHGDVVMTLAALSVVGLATLPGTMYLLLSSLCCVDPRRAFVPCGLPDVGCPLPL